MKHVKQDAKHVPSIQYFKYSEYFSVVDKNPSKSAEVVHRHRNAEALFENSKLLVRLD